MKKSILIFLIILFGISSLCLGEIPNTSSLNRNITYFEYLILKVEMDLREDYPYYDLRMNIEKYFFFYFDFMGFVEEIRLIKIGYQIHNTSYYLQLQPVEKESELTKIIKNTIKKCKRYFSQIEEDDILIVFLDGNVELGRFENGKLIIKE